VPWHCSLAKPWPHNAYGHDLFMRWEIFAARAGFAADPLHD
jgi:hypothetical protein